MLFPASLSICLKQTLIVESINGTIEANVLATEANESEMENLKI